MGSPSVSPQAKALILTPSAPSVSTPKPQADKLLPSFEQPLMPQDKTRVVLPALGQAALHQSFTCNADSASPKQASDEKNTTPGDILKKHGVAVAAEQGVHKGAHQIMARTMAKASGTAGTRAVQHAAGHAVGEALAHGAGHAVGTGGRILARAVPGFGACVAGYLAYKSADHAIEAGKKGNVGAAVSYGAAATVDGVLAGINAVGAATGVGIVISTPVSLVLAGVATGLASFGAWLDD